MNARMYSAKLRDQLRQHARCVVLDGAYANASRDLLGFGFFKKLIVQPQHLPGNGQELLAILCQHKLACAALYKLDS